VSTGPHCTKASPPSTSGPKAEDNLDWQLSDLEHKKNTATTKADLVKGFRKGFLQTDPFWDLLVSFPHVSCFSYGTMQSAQ